MNEPPTTGQAKTGDCSKPSNVYERTTLNYTCLPRLAPLSHPGPRGALWKLSVQPGFACITLLGGSPNPCGACLWPARPSLRHLGPLDLGKVVRGMGGVVRRVLGTYLQRVWR